MNSKEIFQKVLIKLGSKKSLNDWSDVYPELAKGSTEVWYQQGFGGFLGGEPETIEDLEKNFVLLGKIKETNPNRIAYILNVWVEDEKSHPTRQFIQSLGLTHTSMSMGDIVKTKDGYFISKGSGFKKLDLK
jgi:hypothetical protein